MLLLLYRLHKSDRTSLRLDRRAMHMANKNREKKTIDAILKSTCFLDGYTDISVQEQERPDFVFKKGNQIIGLEHIEIPILPLNGQSAELYFRGSMRRLHKKAPETQAKKQEDLIKLIEKYFKKRELAYSEFSHNVYLENCARLLGVGPQRKRKHDASEYLKILKDKYPETNISVAFALDIGYNPENMSVFRCKDTPSGDYIQQGCMDFPLTYVFLVLLSVIRDVNDIYIVWHPFDDYSKAKTKIYEIHFDKNKRLLPNSVIPKVWWEFSIPNDDTKTQNITLEFKKIATYA